MKTICTFRLLLLLPTLLLSFGCGERKAADKREKHVVLVYDPTVLMPGDSAILREQILGDLHGAVATLPTRTTLGMYMVGENNLQASSQFQGSLRPSGQGGGAARKRHAKQLADSVTRLAEVTWRQAHVGPERPASCILSAIRRARSTLAPQSSAASDSARVSLVIISDMMEACDDFGRINFERTLPEKLGALPDSVDLSAVEAVYVVKVPHSSVSDVVRDARINAVWTDLLTRWGVESSKIHIDTKMPDRLF